MAEIAKKKLILIIDDDKLLRTTLSKELIDAGYDVILASDGQEGVDMALDRKPDLLFVDMVMPVMDGLEVLNRLRTNEWGKTVKIIILTNADDVPTLAKTIAVQGHEYMVKTDWKMDQIVEKANSLLKDDN